MGIKIAVAVQALWFVLGILIGYFVAATTAHADEFNSFDYTTGVSTWGTIDRSGGSITVDSYNTGTNSYTTTTITPSTSSQGGYKYNSYDTGTGKLSTGAVESPLLLIPGHTGND